MIEVVIQFSGQMFWFLDRLLGVAVPAEYIYNIYSKKRRSTESRVLTAHQSTRVGDNIHLGGLQMPAMTALGDLISPSGLHGHLCTYIQFKKNIRFLKCYPPPPPAFLRQAGSPVVFLCSQW